MILDNLDVERPTTDGKYVKQFSGFAREAELRLERLEAADELKICI